MNKKPAKLALRTETLRRLADDDVAKVAGGMPTTSMQTTTTLTLVPECVSTPCPSDACPTIRCGL